jgi:hypothetical protein
MNPRVMIGLSATALLAMASAPAAAQSADVKCLLVSNLYSKASNEPKARQIAEAAKFFYMGRVHGRLSDLQLKAQMQALQKIITPKNSAQTMSSCARGMQAAATAIQRVGQQAAPRK